jgi:uncharacterized membrane protein SirB2
MQRYRGHLALAWLGWTCVLVLLLAWRLMQGDQAVADIFAWLTPHLAPTLSLVGGVAVMTKPSPEAEGDPALRTAYLRALIVSIVYLLLVTMAVVSVTQTIGTAGDTLKPWSSVLGFLQGVTAATLGVFFARTPTA